MAEPRSQAETASKERLDRLSDQLKHLVASVATVSNSQTELVARFDAQGAVAAAASQEPVEVTRPAQIGDGPPTPAAPALVSVRVSFEPLATRRASLPRSLAPDWESVFPPNPIPHQRGGKQ